MTITQRFFGAVMARSQLPILGAAFSTKVTGLNGNHLILIAQARAVARAIGRAARAVE